MKSGGSSALLKRFWQWEASGVLRRDGAPCYYAYEQRFAVPELLVDINRIAELKTLRRAADGGLEIGAISPEEIAVSIVAEMIAVRRHALPGSSDSASDAAPVKVKSILATS